MTDITSKKPLNKFEKILNILLILLALYYVYRYSGLLYPSTKVETPAQAQAILYSTKWCPFCIEMRGFFAKNKIRYFEYDINTSKENERRFLQLGGQGVPLTTIGNITIHGMQGDKVLQAMSIHNASKKAKLAPLNKIMKNN